MTLPAGIQIVGSGESAYVEWKVPRNETFKRSIKLYQDVKLLTPLDFTGLTFRLVIDGYITLLSGEGLVLDSASNINITLTPAQAQAAPQEQHRFYLEVEENPENKVAPVRGVFTFEFL